MTKYASPYALDLFTDPVPVTDAAPPEGERYDHVRQLTLLADGTPKALGADEGDGCSRTVGGLTTSTELEMMNVFPDTTTVAGR